MLTEQFIVSIGVPEKSHSATSFAKDAGIFIHEYQPVAAQKHVLKKSATSPNCLAVSESHIFAAQAEKGVVHVYNREKGNHEATVPFTERITCIALACDDAVLVLGTAEGRLFLWETASGRQITTEQAHLQKVTALAVDQTSNFVLSASSDSTVHVWSLLSLLSFLRPDAEPLSPLRTFTSHRSNVSSLALGHSSSFCNFAVSVAQDKTCLIWDFHTMTILRTYLLPVIPTCVALDPADRVAYVGCEDGSVQRLELLEGQGNRPDSVLNARNALAPIQPPKSTILRSPDDSHGTALAMSVSFDGCTVLTGHQSGSVLVWDVARGRFQSSLLQVALPGPATNLQFLPVLGLQNEKRKPFKISSVVKPKFGAFDNSSGGVPANYTINVEIMGDQSQDSNSEFYKALTAPYFPDSLVDKAMSELATWSKGGHQSQDTANFNEEDDFMALDEDAAAPREASLEEQNATLRSELEAMRRLQKASFDKIERMNNEKRALMKREAARTERATHGRNTGQNGSFQGQEETDETSEDE